MGSELVGSAPQDGNDVSNIHYASASLTKQLYEHFPFYLAMGMTYDQYWNEDCTLVKFYREAHKIKNKQRNQELWLQGLYIYEALCDVSPVLHAFAKKGTKPTPYPSAPYPTTKNEIIENKNHQKILQFDKMKSKMIAWSTKTNAQMANIATKEVEKQDG